MIKRKQRIATAIGIAVILLGLLSAYTFMTFNWIGVLVGHVLLGATDMKSVPIAANMVLSRGIFAVGQQLEEDGWHVLEDGGNFITFEKDGSYRNVAVAKENTIGYGIFYVSDVFDKDIYEEQKERQK